MGVVLLIWIGGKMESKKEIRPVLKYTNEKGTQIFNEGDDIICRIEDGKRYTGRIIAFGGCRESEETEPEYVIYLNTSNNQMNCSGEMIKVADIVYMRKVVAGDKLDYPKENESLDRDNFIDMIIGLGYDKGKAEFMYEHMKEFISLYNIPLSAILPYAIQETGLSADGKSIEEFINISNRLLDIMAHMFQSVTDVIKGKRIPPINNA